MKKTPILFCFLLVAVSLCLPAFLARSAEGTSPAVGINSSTGNTAVPTPGLSGASSVPATVSLAPAAQPPSAVAAVEEPVAVRKDSPPAKIEMPAPEKKKKSRREKAEEKARTKALEAAVEQQAQMMRDERAREMPYLDRVYIRTSITPIMVQQKDEFLSGGAKSLQELILRAQSVHTQSKAAHENIALYNRRMLAAFRKLFPEVTITANDRVGTQAAAGNANPYTGNDWKVSLRQPIFSGGILWNTFLQEKAGLESAKKQFDKTVAELVFDLSRAYFEYQRTLQTVEEHRAVVEKMKRFADMSEEKFKEKIISEIEHLNVQSLYSQMQFDLESAKKDLELAKLEMQKDLDLTSHDEITIAKIYDLEDVVRGQAVPAGGAAGGGAAGPKTMPDVFKGEEKAPEMTKLIDLSYGHRPELQVEAAKLQANRLAERVRWGEFLPKAFLSYDFGALGDAYNPALNPANPASTKPALKKQWQLMLEMNWNLGGNKVGYTYGRDYRAPNLAEYGENANTFTRKNSLEVGILDGLDAFVNVKQAEVDRLNQVVELEKAKKQVLQDVKQAYYDYQKSVIQVNSTVKRMEYRKRLRDFVEYKVSTKKEGAELSELMTAESDLVREKAELHEALKEYFTAKAALNHAVGIQDFLNAGTPREKA